MFNPVKCIRTFTNSLILYSHSYSFFAKGYPKDLYTGTQERLDNEPVTICFVSLDSATFVEHNTGSNEISDLTLWYLAI